MYFFPSFWISDPTTSAIMDPINLEIEANTEKVCALAKELKTINQKTHEQEMIFRKATSNIDKKSTYKNNRLSQKECKPNVIIKPKG